MAVSLVSRVSCLLLFAVATSLVFSGCNQSNAFMMNESGKSLYSQGQFTAARREFERALIDNPDNPDYAFNVASAMRKQGDLIGAERMYRHALSLDPRHQPAHHGIAAMLVDQGRVAEADSHLREWADTQPYLPEAHIENAWLRQDMGDLPAAEQSLHRALQANPSHPVALAQLGHLYEVNGRPGEARMMYQRSLSGNPYQSEIKARMAEVGRHWTPPSGASVAAYPPGPQWPVQQASYQPYPSYTPTTPMPRQSVPFQGFASTPGPAPPFGFYGQPMPSSGIPQQMAAPMPSPTPTFTQPAQLGHPQPVTNADPAHVPLSMSAAPIVTPF